MTQRSHICGAIFIRLARLAGVGCLAGLAMPGTALAGQTAAAEHQDVTYTKDIAPILQRRCQTCHRPDSVAPMSLLTYQQARPWARAMKMRTGVGPRAGVMPPWYLEHDIGIQRYKNDPSLSEEEIAKIAAWADNGAPEGNPVDLPEPIDWNTSAWSIGEPDLITVLPDITMKGTAPDWWGEIETTPVGITEDRYVAALEFKEINDVDLAAQSRDTVGGRFIYHHMIWSTQVVGDDVEQDDQRERGTTTGWPVHEVGRNADIFDQKAGRLLSANSSVVSNSLHLHSNGRDTTGHLEIGWKFHPADYEPDYKRVGRGLGNALDIDLRPMETDQELHAYTVLQQNQKITSFEPHLHAPGERMCLEAIWGMNIETLTCVGYDHNWVRTYEYEEDYAPLLPKGTILHITGYMNNSPANRNIPDPRNWQGSGNRSVTNMFIDLGLGVELSDEQFIAEMAERRERLELGPNDHTLGCPLCPYDDIALPEEYQRRPSDADADDDAEDDEDETADEAESGSTSASTSPAAR
ncbi:MAG TPA: hypothetical protein QF572_19065 [Vicinamibacterales bacterium]|nr:hypothetical protein [Vicinamibacterales bacterium]HJN46274.1 hypothetical protein [Vicinamibacterales bacterium]